MTYCASCNFITVVFLFHLVERSVDGILLDEALCIHCNGSEQSFSASDSSGNRLMFLSFCDDKFEHAMFCLNGTFLSLYLWDDIFKSSELEILNQPQIKQYVLCSLNSLYGQWLGWFVFSAATRGTLNWKQKHNSYFDNQLFNFYFTDSRYKSVTSFGFQSKLVKMLMVLSGILWNQLSLSTKSQT